MFIYYFLYRIANLPGYLSENHQKPVRLDNYDPFYFSNLQFLFIMKEDSPPSFASFFSGSAFHSFFQSNNYVKTKRFYLYQSQ